MVAQAGARLTDSLGHDNGACVLIDGLGVWLARVLHDGGAFAEPPDELAAARVHAAVMADLDELAAAAAEPGHAVIIAAEEAGLGMLPGDHGSRTWLDLLGDALQRLTASAQHVELVVAGRPIGLDGGAPPPLAPPPLTAPPLVQPPAGLRSHGDEWVRPGDADHAVNVIAGGPPLWLRRALESALATGVSSYPAEPEAVAALAALYGRTAAEIVPTNGVAEALWLLPAALRPTLAACVHPAFTEGEAALHAHGVPVTRVLRDPERDFGLDPAAVPEAADLVLVGNPASPSGTLSPAAALLALRRPGRTIVIDEAFMDLVPGEPGTLVRDAPPDVIVLRSITKSLSVPGLRAGYAVAAPALADRLRAARRPDATAAAAQRVAGEREDLVRGLKDIKGLRTWPAAANFCLVEVPDGPRVLEALRARRIAVRPAASFPGLGADHLRITARGPAENARLIESLRAAVAACR
jgi:histidinol-phosphate/aromatic aminotransferase/cobyric acid decarboxylase-like protein/adenosyl cobinamide kinase/adenosyl cobinamide phosphate guanylyltransferase